MVVVGGQDGANHYIEQISVFNLRSLKWTSTQPLGKSCGAYRSVCAPLPPAVTAKIGKANTNGAQRSESGISQEAREPGSSMLIYSNYNFLDVKLELQVRSSDGTLSEKPMSNAYSPPGLRFPNGGVIDTYFVVSGTYLTSSKQEYALWALDLRSLQWMRIDAGGNVFKEGSWNRGVLWGRRNTFVILGHRKRSLVDDYNHRRINFTNVCMVELEAFGFYDNPRKVSPMSGFISASGPYTGPGLSLARKAGATAGGRFHSRASEELGEKALAIRELADMDILCIGVAEGRHRDAGWERFGDAEIKAIVDRLHTLFENRNAAAIFNATAMAAGGGRGIDGTLNPNYFIVSGLDSAGNDPTLQGASNGTSGEDVYANGGAGNRATTLRINTSVPGQTGRPPSDELSATTSVSGSEWSASEISDSERRGRYREVWSGEFSSVIGLQKRGLRGLMEGRKLRERTGTATGANPVGTRVGLGIAGGS
ncbi:putative kelch domain-containing protein [Diaporthe ampelina]|uniref:Putative kelch domain-containing protein n=1 Tax=Diaporthe ampelina TaxID=1214573 RepID=A0A0G2H4R8_9PEZI|nr:putative kelch domain-containing protein [Diaporthe ampelina]